mgnify:FL=1
MTNQIGKPGAETSEFKRTKWAQWAAVVLPIVATILAAIIDQGLITNGLWAGVAAAGLSTMAALGYSSSRSKTKAAEAIGAAQVQASGALGKPEA